MIELLAQTIDFLKSKGFLDAEFGIILGSGLGNFNREVQELVSINYADIPNFPQSTVKGHGGRLVYGTLEDKRIILMCGRFHYYEGYTIQEVSFPVRVMKALGIHSIIVSNASGSLKPGFKVEDVMLINDHINFQPVNPLVGKNEDELGPRFPDMLNTYDETYLNLARAYGENHNLNLKEGVYIGVQGPTFETPAEYRMFHLLGADAVGMSTVSEIIVARHASLKIFALSVIADIGYPLDEMENITHDMVVNAAVNAEPKMTMVVKHVLANS